MRLNEKHLSRFLADPQPGITLDQLASELNELAKIRDNARLAFCKRLAVVYLMIVGHPPYRGSQDTASFFKWCFAKIKSANGKKYSSRTLSGYVTVGFSKNPEKYLQQRDQKTRSLEKVRYTVATSLRRAILTDTPPKVVPITRLKAQGMPTDTAREVNQLMTAWEQASSQARAQFMYIVTGKRIAA